jgi:hypothetical protein
MQLNQHNCQFESTVIKNLKKAPEPVVILAAGAVGLIAKGM